MRTWIAATALLAGSASLAWAQIAVNEILFHPVAGSPAPADHAWVELHNKGSEPADAGGWMIANRDGRESPNACRLPAITIPPAGYLVVHFTSGEDRLEFGPDGAHVYTGSTANPWNPDQDAVALYSPVGIADFLAWRRRDDAAQSGPAYSDSAAAGIWPEGVALVRDFILYEVDDLFRVVRPGTSLGRDQDAIDTNGPRDFEPNGGRHSFFPTPGRRNLEEIETYLVPEDSPGTQDRAAEPEKAWTVLWYFAGVDEYPDLTPFLDLQANGGSTANVNYVIHWTRAAATTRGRISPTGPPGKVRLFSPDGPNQVRGVNAASRTALKDFVEWGKAHFPAGRYALVIVGYGDGWKWLGSNAAKDGRFDSDRLYPGELSGALGGAGLDLLCLDTNYSAMAELAWQVRGSAKSLLAFPDLARLDFTRLAQILSADPAMDGQTLGSRQVLESRVPMSLTDLTPLPELIELLRQWSGQLVQAIPIFRERDQPLDNAQTGIFAASASSLKALDGNFVDLADFATKVQESPAVPACGKQAIAGILRWININVLSAAPPFPGVPPRRFNIHFPSTRAHRPANLPFPADPHDLPSGAREVDGNSRPVTYSLNYSMLPLDVAEEDGPFPPPLIPPAEWPRKRAPDFPFPDDSGWQRFLDDVYHPQPDNRIVEATFGGRRLLPVSKGGAECRNPVDEITVPVGGVVSLSGRGSSDFDPKNGGILPYTYMWDLNHRQPCSRQPCLGPHEVAPGADALLVATNNVDADADIADTRTDDLDSESAAPQFQCTEAGEWITFLHVGDDDHTETHADTMPTARHVHPQTRSWPSKIICAAPGTFVSTGAATPFLETGTYVYSDHAVRAAAGAQIASARGFVPHQAFVLTLTGGTDLRVNDVPAANSTAALADETSGVVYADQDGILRTRFTAGPAGSGSLRIQPLGMPVFNLPFTVVNRLAPLPTDLQVTPPAGNVTVGADASLTIAVTRDGQPLGDAIVTAWSPTSTLTWVNGTRFRSDTATLFRAGSTGSFLATFRATANGPVLIHIVAGQILRTLTLNATGGPRGAPTSIEILPVTVPLVQGAEGTVTFRVLGAQLGLSGVTVRVEFQSGSVAVAGRTGTGPAELATDAQGEAVLRLVPNSLEPVSLQAVVPGTNLSVGANLPVHAR
ncbi:MAG: lamin tail domain-containing protein [Bryobacteraceae bacterium]|nr:lamin tail domain-containing protein [Bryobacteraceae bacterium]